MAGKAGGRLTFSGRQEYQVTPVYDLNKHTDTIIGYRAYCPCALGYHYLTYEDDGDGAAPRIIERTASLMRPAYIFSTYADAQAAIEQWQRQHAAQAASGESEG